MMESKLKEYESYKSPLEKGYAPTLLNYDGCWVLEMHAKAGKLEWIRDLEVRDDDVFIIGYPKSGLTWTIESIYLLMNNADTDKATSAVQADRVPYLEYPEVTPELVANMESPRLLKTHLHYNLIPRQLRQGKGKVIYVYRNGKDVSVSLYHFTQFMTYSDFQGTFEEYFEEFMTGKVLYGPWVEHVASFCKQRNNSNLLFVSYEDLTANYQAEVLKIATFINKEVSASDMAKIEEFCSFKNLQGNNKANFSHLVKEGVMKEERANVGLMRKGIVGDWKNYYTKEQEERLQQLLKDTLGPLGLRFNEKEEKWTFD